MEKKKTYWLVDLENTGGHWSEARSWFNPGDTIAIFWSEKTCDLSMKSLPVMPDLEYMYIKCCNGTPNAMDFQLCAWLGRMCALQPDARFRILSGDKGYTPLQKFLPETYGADVALLNPHDASILDSPSTANSVRTQYNAMLESVGMADPEDRRIMSAILMQAMIQPKGRRRLDMRYRLSARYGAVDGNLRYNAVKDVIKRIAEHGPWPGLGNEQPVQAASPPPARSAPEKPQTTKQNPKQKPIAPKITPVTAHEINQKLQVSGIPLKKGQAPKAFAALTASAHCEDLKAAQQLLKGAIESIFAAPNRAKAYAVLSALLS